VALWTVLTVTERREEW